MCGLPNMSVVVPCDAIETRKATSYLLLQYFGPKYIRFAREATPIVTKEETPFVFGKANVIRLQAHHRQVLWKPSKPVWLRTTRTNRRI